MLRLTIGNDTATLTPDAEDDARFWDWAEHAILADLLDEGTSDGIPYQPTDDGIVMEIGRVAQAIEELKAEGFIIGR